MTNTNRTCVVDDCAEPVKSLGKCKRHYLQDYYVANRERDREKRRAYYRANAEKYKRRALINGAISRAADPQKERDRSRRKYAQLSPARKSAGWKRRAASEAHADRRVILPSDWQRLLCHYNHRCAYCAADGELTQDHVIPFARGGRHAIGNVLPACAPCNQSKGTKFLVEWRQYRRLIAPYLER